MKPFVKLGLAIFAFVVIATVANTHPGAADPGPWCYACASSCEETTMETACQLACGADPYEPEECRDDEWDFCDDYSPSMNKVVTCDAT